ncbi:MAG: tRNA methyltransferase [Rhodobiaceae bacterium]|nr:MAG: tRNA methyltransferase [Rhodobiaceae bacterium]
MRIALYQPDIPQNTGNILRLGACLNVPVDIIEPCGFPLSDRGLKRAGLDYLTIAAMKRFDSWEIYLAELEPQARLILLTTSSATPYTNFAFTQHDVLLMGRESAGVPKDVHDRADAQITIPMAPKARSLNVSSACAIVTSEALRQLNGFPS